MRKTIHSLIFLFLGCGMITSFVHLRKQDIFPDLKNYIQASTKKFNEIPAARRKQLKKISDFVTERVSADRKAELIFICTHNSRRSHMAQIWAQTAAEYYDVKNVYCYSGGTEATAFNTRAVNALTASGFKITRKSENNNPVYEVAFSNDVNPLKAFSKKYNDSINPQMDFCAVMTCSQADKSCPMVEGAAVRIAIPYEDPKVADGTEQEEQRYNERCRQIATEMLYVFSLCRENKIEKPRH